MIRAAIATKHKYGNVILTDYERERCELLSGYKLENTWLGKNEDEGEARSLEKDENGNYIILIDQESKKETTDEIKVGEAE